MITARVRVETTEVVRSHENLDKFNNKTKNCQLLWDLRKENRKREKRKKRRKTVSFS